MSLHWYKLNARWYRESSSVKNIDTFAFLVGAFIVSYKIFDLFMNEHFIVHLKSL